MKRTFLYGIFLMNYLTGFSQGLSPSNAFPCLNAHAYYTPSSGHCVCEFSSSNCIEFYDPTLPGHSFESGNWQIISGKSIHIKENMHINFESAPGSGTGDEPKLHAFIAQNDFDVFWFEPNSTIGTVGKFEKLELGLRIPSTLKTSIENYVNDVVTTDKINPFNPDEISIEAEFYFLGTSTAIGSPPDKKVFGFYYKEYERIIVEDSDLSNDFWNTDTTTFPFRVRFAPDKLGNWAVKIKIITPTTTLQALPVNFICVESDNPGFIKIGTNNKFLQLDGQPFMPVGQNLVWPRCDEIPGCEWVDAYDIEKIAPTYSYKKFEDYMQEFKSKGGNYFRLIITPWTFDIEFEDLGNYSYRMKNVWELDKIIEKAKELDLRMQLCLTLHTNFEEPAYFGMKNWDWTLNSCVPVHFDNAYAYSDDLGLTVQQFFGSTIARDYYEKRLRYILSRVNYSTTIGVYEIASELNNFGSINEYFNDGVSICNPADKTLSKPYHENPTFTMATKDWVSHMAGYIKNTLGHDQHLLSTCYTGSPFDDQPLLNGVTVQHSGFSNGDDSPLDDLFDIVSYNAYSTTVSQHRSSVDAALEYTWSTGASFNNTGKPTMHSEIGPGSYIIACNNDVEWIKTVYISPFTGIAATLNWDNALKTDLWIHFANLRNFLDVVLSENNIASEYWHPLYSTIETADEDEIPQVEEYHLDNSTVTSFANRAFGIVVNRTYNGLSEYNDMITPTSDCSSFMESADVTDNYPPQLSHRIGIADVDGAHELNLPFLDNGDYTVEWYEMDGSHIPDATQTEHVSALNHKLELDFPNLELNTVLFRPMVFFKAYKDESKMLHLVDDTNHAVLPERQFKSCHVFPNPANTFKPLNITCNESIVQVQLRDNAGKILTNFKEVSTVLNLPALQRGIYFIKVILYDGNEENHRIVVLD